MARDLSFLLPEIMVALTAAIALIAEMLGKPRAALWLSIVGLAIGFALTFPVVLAGTEVFSGTYLIDRVSGWAKLILLPSTALAMLIARAELAGQPREGSIYALMSLILLGALMLSGGGDIMVLVLGVVLTGLGSFALVAFPRNDGGTEAAMKYLVFGSVTGAIMIYGLSFWYGGAGDTLLREIGKAGMAQPVFAAGLLGLLAGLGYKAALFPLHFWAPDAYEGAPVSIAGFLSVVPKLAAIFALYHAFAAMPPQAGWSFALALIAAASMSYGYLAALVQNQMVRLLAYSSIAQSGYFLLALVALPAGQLARPALILFAIAYAAMNLGMFALIAGTGPKLAGPKLAGPRLADIKGFGRSHPLWGATMVIFLLSLTGIPPLFGFFGKAYLFGASLEAGFLWLGVIAILNSVLALAVYLRVVVVLYQPLEPGKTGVPALNPHLQGVGALTLLVIVLGGLAVGLLPL